MKTYTIANETIKVGKLTLGAALEIENHLKTLRTPFEVLQDSQALSQIDKDLAERLINEKLQQEMFWPPDAITALCDQKFLTRAGFGIVFISAMIRAYNPHFEPQEVDRLASRATVQDVIQLQLIAFDSDNNQKKDEPTTPANSLTSEPTGAVSWPS